MLPEPARQVGLHYGRWRHHRSPPPQFRHGTGGQGNILKAPAFPTITHKAFGLTDLTSRDSVRTRRVFSIGNRPRPSGLESDT
ncbi:hypothetical protein TNCV_598951 [Trichonephila clavipes]|nr:hypothetical protein TNCV_598951 [Trichonephila clavipes]